MPESTPVKRRATRIFAALAVSSACLLGGAATASSQVSGESSQLGGETEAHAGSTETTTDAPQAEVEGSSGPQDNAEAPPSGSATDAQEPTDDAAEPPTTDPEDGTAEQPASPASARQDGRVRLTLEKAGPSEAYYAAKRKVTFRYEFAGSSRRDLRIQVVKKRNQEPVRAWVRENVEPREGHRIRWGGSKREGGPVNSDKYMFRIREVDGEFAERSRAQGRRIFTLRQHKFPVRGRHSYGDGFGAGRGHQGVDIFARCGTPLIAARAGRVQYRGYHSSAGNYTVIDGRGTRRDYVYMHLKQSARFAKGRRVKVGQTVGRVGETGNASGCHLHFEIWNGPGWYEGGSPSRRVKPILRDWDDYS